MEKEKFCDWCLDNAPDELIRDHYAPVGTDATINNVTEFDDLTCTIGSNKTLKFKCACCGKIFELTPKRIVRNFKSNEQRRNNLSGQNKTNNSSGCVRDEIILCRECSYRQPIKPNYEPLEEIMERDYGEVGIIHDSNGQVEVYADKKNLSNPSYMSYTTLSTSSNLVLGFKCKVHNKIEYKRVDEFCHLRGGMNCCREDMHRARSECNTLMVWMLLFWNNTIKSVYSDHWWDKEFDYSVYFSGKMMYDYYRSAGKQNVSLKDPYNTNKAVSCKCKNCLWVKKTSTVTAGMNWCLRKERWYQKNHRFCICKSKTGVESDYKNQRAQGYVSWPKSKVDKIDELKKNVQLSKSGPLTNTDMDVRKQTLKEYNTALLRMFGK